ncbi:hypothetical protein KP509_07G017700 [Ceratopteris richardii]|uniref:Uncharacterized protein n=1 Tax=Ceratopteris richardii TaxID=49495 RepID=A0A8T2U7V8_CERRI|nr:hypothetical protein KP509_07G017700 [Ceratopteris richardii]
MVGTANVNALDFMVAPWDPNHAEKGFGFPLSWKKGHASLCRSRSDKQHCARAQYNDRVLAPNGLYLHHLMDKAGIETCHAKAARESFVKEVVSLRYSDCNNESISSPPLDLARAALEISSEDDALVSHSSVPLPVDAFLDRLNKMALEFASHHLPSHPQTSESVLRCLDKYLYGYKKEPGKMSDPVSLKEDAALESVLSRLRLILAERRWNAEAADPVIEGPLTDPW